MTVVWKFYNTNPIAAREEDCSVRAVSAALGVSWDEAFEMIANNAKQMGTMMHKDAAWGSVLRQNGFYRTIVPNYCPDCYTAADFCADNPDGIFVLGFGTHTATVIDGTLLDTWDSSDEVVVYVWYRGKKPKF